MGSVYLTEMANWFRTAGLAVVEYSGWKTRARSSGGFEPGRPWCVMWHHTASQTAPENDADYMCNRSPDKPIANILLARDGTAWVLAAGATNTNGKGGPATFSKGTVPLDAMNTYAVGVEIANDGVGQMYPQAQIDAAFKISIAITDALGLRPDDCYEHQYWAPTRKIDPAKGRSVQGPWMPREANGAGTWHIQDLRSECTKRSQPPMPPTPPPPPIPASDQEDEMTRQLVRNGNHKADAGDTEWNAFICFAGGKYWLPTNEALTQAQKDFGYAPIDVTDDWMRAAGPVVGPNPSPVQDAWGCWNKM